MIGQEKSQQKAKIESPEQVLNVIRESNGEVLSTPEMAQQLPVGERSTQKYVKSLHEEGRLVLVSEGRPNRWRLAESEPTEPVYREEMAKAIQISNKASDFGFKCFMYGVSLMAGIGVVATLGAYSIGFDIPIPITGSVTDMIAAGIIGILGVILFVIAFISFFVAFTLPKTAEWYFDEWLPEE